MAAINSLPAPRAEFLRTPQFAARVRIGRCLIGSLLGAAAAAQSFAANQGTIFFDIPHHPRRRGQCPRLRSGDFLGAALQLRVRPQAASHLPLQHTRGDRAGERHAFPHGLDHRRAGRDGDVPAGGVDITTAFTLDGSQFLNMTDFQVQFALSLALFELTFDGLLFGVADAGLTWAEIVDLPNHLVVANFGLDLFDPIQLGRIGTPQGVAFGLDGSVLQAGPSFQVTAVPEPESWLLMLAGAALVAGAARRRTLRNRVGAY